ncbi:MAG TPA: hypothetical protein VGR29_07050 [Thermomicrobiales bacterium]|nr:hypothetical protein [Thermomicrobiales bacterium]
MMRNRRGAPLLLVLMLVVGMIGAGQNVLAFAQNASIQPAGESGGGDEIVVNGARYLRDREVTVNPNPLQQVADENGNSVYVKPGGSDPLGAVYVLAPEGGDRAVRYLPEFVGDPAAACPSDLVARETIQGNGATYVAAGPETDMNADQLTEIGTSDDGAIIYAYSPEQPFEEILVAQSQGQGNVPLTRYVMTGPDGVPAPFSDGLAFAGQQFAPVPGAVTSIEGLTKVGCAGLFPAYSQAQEQPFSTITLQVGDQAVSFQAPEGDAGITPVESTPPPALPTEVVATPPPPTEVVATPPPPTEVPPTATLAPEPTATATPEPTSTATPEPTATSTPEPTTTATPEPTATATAEPTATATPEPTVTATAEPTATLTPEPTATATPEPTPTATAEPTATATSEPTATATPEPTTAPTQAPTAVPTDAVAQPAEGEEPTALPTEVPPTTAPGTVEPTLPASRPTPIPQPLQPRAVVPTLPAGAPSPAASDRTTDVTCSGETGALDADGVPDRLPTSIQYGGTGYRYTGQIAVADAGSVEAVGCVGGFVIFEPAEEADAGPIYLALDESPETLFRFEQARSFTVQSQVADQPRTIDTAGTEQQPAVRYRAAEPLVRSTYSSLSLIVYVADADIPAPERLLGYAVGGDVFAEYMLEGTGEQASQEVLAEAETFGVLGEMLLGGQRYVLTSLWTPYGTTTNGWVTLYGPAGEDAPEQLVGLDPRREDLMVFNRTE